MSDKLDALAPLRSTGAVTIRTHLPSPRATPDPSAWRAVEVCSDAADRVLQDVAVFRVVVANLLVAVAMEAPHGASVPNGKPGPPVLLDGDVIQRCRSDRSGRLPKRGHATGLTVRTRARQGRRRARRRSLGVDHDRGT